MLQTVLDDARTSMALASEKSRGVGGGSSSSPGAFRAPLNMTGTGNVQYHEIGKIDFLFFFFKLL